jgi:hypothetical protein
MSQTHTLETTGNTGEVPAQPDLDLTINMDAQSASPLFTVFPPEIRAEIFTFALASFPDLSNPYPFKSYWYRPGYTAPKRTELSLLVTCKRIYDEAKDLVWKEGSANDEEAFWWGSVTRRPPEYRAGEGSLNSEASTFSDIDAYDREQDLWEDEPDKEEDELGCGDHESEGEFTGDADVEEEDLGHHELGEEDDGDGDQYGLGDGDLWDEAQDIPDYGPDEGLEGGTSEDEYPSPVSGDEDPEAYESYGSKDASPDISEEDDEEIDDWEDEDGIADEDDDDFSFSNPGTPPLTLSHRAPISTILTHSQK